MRPRTLAILAALVGALAAFIWFFEGELPSSAERVEQAKRIVALDADEVERLVIEWGDELVELTRVPKGVESADSSGRNSGWWLERPLRGRAETTSVEGLVTRLVGLEKERTLEDVGRADVGLSEPRGRVTLATGSGTTVLEIGAEIPASDNMTLAVEGAEEVFVVGSSVWETLTREPGEWRDKRLFVGEREDIERIVVHSGDRVVELAKRGEEFWVESPMADRASEPEVGALLSAITGLRAESFVDEALEPSELGLDPAWGGLEIFLAEREAPLRLEVGLPVAPDLPATGAGEAEESQAGQAHYLRLADQIVTTTAELTDHLERAPENWLSLDWVQSESFDVDRIFATDVQGGIELRREDGDWLRDGERIVFGPATDLLHAVTGAQADRVLDVDAESLGAPRVTLVLESADGAQETAWLYEMTGEGFPVRVSSREAVLLLSPEAAAEVSGAIEAARTAELDGAELDGIVPDDA